MDELPKCNRSQYFVWSFGSRANATGWKDDRYSCHATEDAAKKAFQKRCKPGSTALIGKGSIPTPFGKISCKR